MSQAYQPLHHKYRPQRFQDLVGQQAIAATLSNALTQRRIAPAYLFSGPRGTGKTSSARILARSLNCQASEAPTPDPCGRCELCRSIAAGTALDVIEIDAASNTGVDNIRDLIERSRFAPVQARWKVYVIDECHMLSTAAFNALLKTLEEPPPRVVFVLATTDPQRVLPTILSRCQRFDFRRIPLPDLRAHLALIAEREGIAITAAALDVVARRAQGGLRDAESLLDQLSLLPGPVETQAVWELLGVVPEEEVLALTEALVAEDPLALVETTRGLLERGREAGAVLQGLAGSLRDLVLAGAAPERPELIDLAPELRERVAAMAQRVDRSRLLQWHHGLQGSETQLRLSAQPRLWLEVLLLGLLAEARASEPDRPPPPPLAARAAAAPPPAGTSAPAAPPAATPAVPPPADQAGSADPAGSATAGADLEDLWQRVLASLELPSTRMLLSQQAHLIRVTGQRAVVRVSGNWLAMVQSRRPLLEQAVAKVLGDPREVVLEAGVSRAEPVVRPPAPIPAPAPAPRPIPASASAPARTTAPPPPAAPSAAPKATPKAAPDPVAPPVEGGLEREARRLADFFAGEVVPEEDDRNGPGERTVV